MRRWRKVKCILETSRAFGVVFLSLTMKLVEEVKKKFRRVAVIVSIIVIWLLYQNRDPCRGKQITENLCKDYFSGEVAGQLCSALCRDKSIYLAECAENGDMKSFHWRGSLMRVPADAEHPGRELALVEGMMPSEFVALLEDYLQIQLGANDFIDLIRRLKKFADFNEDGKLSLGEAQALWRLVHNQEFLVLFIFQGSYVFPSLNGTCGSLFGFHYPHVSSLYNKNTFPLHLLSSTAYRWFLPSWEQRAKVAVGILDFMFDIYEENHIKFFMCDVQPLSFGQTFTSEAVITNARNIYSGAMLANLLSNRTCTVDHHCHFSHYCTTMCDAGEQRCTGEVTKPTLWQACHLIEEYLLFDTPEKIHPVLERLLSRCSHLIIYGQSIDMSHVILIADIKTVLWNHIKNINIR